MSSSRVPGVPGLLLAAALLGGASAASAAAAEETPTVTYKVVADVPTISAEAAKKGRDWWGNPDWGLCLEGVVGNPSVIPIDEGGTGYIEVAKGATVTATIVEIDPFSYDKCTPTVALPLKTGEQKVRFGDESSVAVTLTPFDADAASGPDAQPAGAVLLKPAEAHRDHVDFVAQDRTDTCAFVLERTAWVDILVCYRSGVPAVEWLRDGVPTPFAGQGAAGEGHVRCSGRLEQGRQVLRLRAPAGSGPIDYDVIFVVSEQEGEKREVLVRFLLDRCGRGPAAPGEVSAAETLVAVIAALDAPPVRAALVAGLDHAQDGARAAAAAAVGALRVKEALPRLEKLAKDDPSEEVRTAATEALERLH